jgi:ketosteroid isomerase-like protein
MSAAATVRKYHEAWTSNDVDAAMEFVAEDVVCHAPGGDLVGRAAYDEFIRSFAPMLTGTPEIAEFEDGERVALFYLPQTAVTATTVCGELFAVRDGLVVETWLAFDRLSYGPPQ